MILRAAGHFLRPGMEFAASPQIWVSPSNQSTCPDIFQRAYESMMP